VCILLYCYMDAGLRAWADCVVIDRSYAWIRSILFYD
jgi:hypothetical protein